MKIAKTECFLLATYLHAWYFSSVQNDAVSELLSTHFPGSARKTQLTVEQVTMDTQGLRRLIVSQTTMH